MTMDLHDYLSYRFQGQSLKTSWGGCTELMEFGDTHCSYRSGERVPNGPVGVDCISESKRRALRNVSYAAGSAFLSSVLE